MTEARLYELLNIAETKIQELLSPNLYIDDIAWGTDCFRIPIWRYPSDTRAPFPEYPCQVFSFYYDPDDMFNRSDLEQLTDEINRFFSF